MKKKYFIINFRQELSDGRTIDPTWPSYILVALQGKKTLMIMIFIENIEILVSKGYN